MKTQILTLALLLGSFSAYAEDLKADREVRQEDHKRVETDREKLMQDKKAGASAEQIAADKKTLRQDRKELRKARQKVRADKEVKKETTKQ